MQIEKRTQPMMPVGPMGPSGSPISIPAKGNSQQEWASIAYMAMVLWRRRWIVAGSILVALAAGVVYLAKVTPVYSSASKIYIQQNGTKIIADGDNLQVLQNNYLTTQCDLIRSSAILSAALESPEV